MLKILLILFIPLFLYPSFAFASGSVYGSSTTCSGYSSPQAYCDASYGTGLYTAVQRETDWGCRNNSTNAVIQGSHNCISGGSCPVNSTGSSGSCTCNTGFAPSTDGFSCVSTLSCTAGNTVSTGFYDLGTDPSVSPVTSTCSGGCGATYEGSGISARRLVNGIYHYYSVGAYVSTASACSGSDLSNSDSALPTDQCASNQSAVIMGGKTKCYSDSGVPSDPNSASAVASATSAGDLAAQSAIQAARDMESDAGLSPGSGVGGAGSVAAGNIASDQSQDGKDQVERNFCKENPESKICLDQDFGEVSDTALDVLEKPVSITPVSIGSAGTCPAPTSFTIAGRTGNFSWTTYCNFASGIKPIMLVFAWLSAAGILIGGFKS